MKKLSYLITILAMALILSACDGKKGNQQPAAVPTEVPVISESPSKDTADVPSGEETAAETGKTNETAKEPLPGEENLGQFRAVPVDGVIIMPSFGIKVTLPESVRDLPVSVVGMVMEHFAYANFYLVQNEDPNDPLLSFLMIYAYPDRLDQDGMMEHIGFTGDIVSELGNNEALYYYGLHVEKIAETMSDAFDETYLTGITESQKEDHKTLTAADPEILQSVEILDLILPKIPKPAELGSAEIMDYVMPDLDGNDVRLGDLIKENKVTMLNVWGITCGPCMLEMPSLMELSRKYQGRGFSIIGLTSDIMDFSGGIDPNLVNETKEIIADLNIEYPILAMTRQNYDQMKIAGTPTTYFVDSTGSIIGDPIMGSKTENEWEKLITDALANLN